MIGQRAMEALLELTATERGLVLCWFCQECFEEIGPGKSSKCGSHDVDAW